MRPQALIVLAGVIGLLGCEPPIRAQQVREAAGVEVLPRGPVHEAFARPIIRGPRPAPVVEQQPPNPINELPPSLKPAAANVWWIPGYWFFDDERADYIWVSGVWRLPPPERTWVPGYWHQSDSGWQRVSGFWVDSRLREIEYLPEPPDPIVEAIFETDADGVYVPGCWIYQGGRYVWRPGFRVAFKPGWIWVPAHYVWTPLGYVFVEGYWDHDFQQRGLLFAPAYIERRFWAQPGWVYQPQYVVPDAFLLAAMFVRPGFCHYYFGDYYDPRYEGWGMTSWPDFRFGRQGYDPLYSYYRWQNRANGRWERDLQGLYAARRSGAASRPPRTFAQQQELQRTPTARQDTTVTAVTPITQVSQTNIKLQPVTKVQINEMQKTAVRMREAANERRQFEAKVRERAAAPSAPLKVALPQAAPAVKEAEPARAAPPAPAVPRPEAKPVPQQAPPAAPPPAPKGPPAEKPKAAPEPKDKGKQPPPPPAPPPPEPKAKTPPPPEPKGPPAEKPKAAPAPTDKGKQPAPPATPPPPEPKAKAPPEPKGPPPKAAPVPPQPVVPDVEPKSAPPKAQPPKDRDDDKGKGKGKDKKKRPPEP